MIFNQDLSRWDTSKVLDMYEMFAHCWHFDSDISLWDTLSVTNMNGMLANAKSFQQDISTWQGSAATSSGQGIFQVHLYSIRNFFVRKATMDQSVLALAKRIVSADYAAQHSMPP
jgi:surface protein